MSGGHAGGLEARICGLGDDGRAIGGGAAYAGGCRRRSSRGGFAGVAGSVRPLFPLWRVFLGGLFVRCLSMLFVCLGCRCGRNIMGGEGKMGTYEVGRGDKRRRTK